jgi:hypothetical protein
MQKEVQIDWKDGEKSLKGTVTLKRLLFREKNLLEEESTNITVVNGQSIIKVSMSKLKELSLLKGIIGSELYDSTGVRYVLDSNGIGTLAQEVGDLLFEEFTKLNSIEEKKN